MLNFLLWGVRDVWMGRQICDLFSFGHYCFWLFCYFCCDLTLLLSVILLFPLWFDIIALGYFVISIVIWRYLLPIIMSMMIEQNMPLLLSIICCSLWLIFTMSSILLYVLCDGLSKTPKIEVLYTFVRTPFFNKVPTVPGLQAVKSFLCLRKIDWKK